VAVDPSALQVKFRLSAANLASVVWRHAVSLPGFVRRLGDCRPGLVISNSEQLFLGGMAARRLGIPHLKIFHALTFHWRLRRRPSLRRSWLNLLSARTDGIVAVSQTMRRALVESGLEPGRITVIPNPIPVRRLREEARLPLPADLERVLAGRFPLIVTAGVLFPSKGQDRLLEALPAVAGRCADLLCLVVGRPGEDTGLSRTGSYATSLKQRGGEPSLAGRVVFMEETDHLPALMGRADIYVQPSRTESFGRTAAEALVCGTPTVVFDAGALPETVGPGGIVVPDGDIGALAEAIVRLAERPDLRAALAEAGARHVEASFEASVVAPRFQSLVRRHLGAEP
jgi:glycosyltransferase involved in cell wall biosynthesis